MDELNLLKELGDVDPPDVAVIEQTALALDAGIMGLETSAPRGDRHRRRLWGLGVIAVAAAATALAIFPPWGSPVGSPPLLRHHRADAGSEKPTRPIELIAAHSAARATSGTATVISQQTGTNGTLSSITYDVQFSGSNANWTIATNAHGTEGAQFRVVNGRMYSQGAGSPIWIERAGTLTQRNSLPQTGDSIGGPFFDPRRLFGLLTPSAGFVSRGTSTIDGAMLTRYTAESPTRITVRDLLGFTGAVGSLTIWVTSNDVVQRLSIRSSWNVRECGPTSCTTSPRQAIDAIQLANLGQPEVIPAPPVTACNQPEPGTC